MMPFFSPFHSSIVQSVAVILSMCIGVNTVCVAVAVEEAVETKSKGHMRTKQKNTIPVAE